MDTCPVIAAIFEERAAASPDAIAVIDADRRLSFRELDRRANQLARLVPAGRIVAVQAAPSLETVIALVAIWKAGGVYLPLDVRWPKRRVARIFEEAQPALIFGDEILRAPRSEPDCKLGVTVGGGELAYLMYTSGSTGRPKGVEIEHAGVVQLLRAQQSVLGVGPGDRVLQFASLGFDASIAEMVMALGSGATLVLAPAAARLGPGLLTTLRQERITLAILPPSLLAQLAVESLPDLRALNLAGEPFGAALVERWAPGRQLFNHYGPTEATVWSTVERCEPGREPGIGAAIPGVETRVVDGELWISGAGVARGYFRQPELTAERFVIRDGRRWYRSGDRVRLDGERLIFVGRGDDQVKLRGMRVELGEVEAALSSHPNVAAAAVAVRGDRLCAWVVPAVPADLDAHLRGLLPETMLPSSIAALAQLPRTTAGKVDRSALPLEAVQSGAGGPARSDGEKLIARLFGELLAVDPVGVDDDFFTLGGHSLLAARLLARILNETAVELPFNVLTELSTVAELSRYVGSAPRIAGTQPTPTAPVSERAASSGERRLFAIEQREPGRAVYNAPLLLRLRGPRAHDTDELARALDVLVARHEALRTTYIHSTDGPRAVIAPPRAGRWQVVHTTEPELAALVAEDAARPFELAVGPLFRATIARTSDGTALVLNFHHIVIDGWSAALVAHELVALYDGLALPEQQFRYADFVAWEQRRVAGVSLDYWHAQLADTPPLQLPSDHMPPPSRSRRGGRVSVDLPLAPIVELARANRATPYMVLLAAFDTLLYRYTEQTDIAVAAAVANRRQALAGVVGFFVNTLLLRVDLSGEPSFRDLIARVRGVALDAFAHEELPFEHLAGQLPELRAMLVLEAPSAPPIADGVTVTIETPETGAAMFDLLLSLEERDGRLSGWLTYDAELFERTTAERLVAAFTTLVDDATRDPSRPITRLVLGGQPLIENTSTTFDERPVHAQLPENDAPALIADGATLSFAELSRRANEHAERFSAARGRPVTLDAVPSLETLISMLGILRAGAICTPLDPTQPHARRAALVERLDKLQPTSDGAAYLLFTSGSTGRPKGVRQTHRTLANLVAWQNRQLTRGPTLQLAPLTFDVSFQEIFTTWCAGDPLVVAPPDARRDLELLGTLIAEHRIARLFLPTVLLQQLAERYWDEPARLQSLRHIIVAGEALRITREIRRLFAALPSCTLDNQYGPTETHVVSAHRLSGDPAVWPSLPPIGRPIANTRIDVLSPHGEPVPVGASGEICITGAGVALGYLDAEDTGFAGEQYKTGDIGRWRSDGDLEFLHRRDEQVKIRGHRIELGEIEAVLASHEQVQTALVVARDDGTGKRLVAYVVPSAVAPTQRALSAHLAAHLPAPMLPSAIVVLDALPLNAHGKVDKAALPAPQNPVERSHRAPPRSDAEERIAAIWVQLLRVDRVGIDDDFFQIGGHSLLATQLAGRVSKAFSVPMKANDVFDYPTVATQAALVAELLDA
jgi:amino acid adenylation domain-containing protein